MENQGDQREPNIDIAFTIANHLNTLIDEGTLNSVDVSHASEHILDEFVLRYMTKEVTEGRLTLEDKAKIKSLFHSENAEYLESPPSPEEVLQAVRTLHERLQERNCRLAGILVYGSSVDPEKRIRKGTDGDLIPVLQEGLHKPNDAAAYGWSDSEIQVSGEEIFDEELEMMIKWVIQRGDVQLFERLPIQIADVYTFDTYTSKIQNLEKGAKNWLERVSQLPHWAWNPTSVFFVSADPQIEQAMQSRLQAAVTSANASQARTELLEKYKAALAGITAR